MANRRQVIGAGLALTVLPLLGKGLSWVGGPVAAPVAVGRMLVDERFPDALEMAARVAGAGIPLTVMTRDVLGLWHDELLPAFLGGHLAALGGITTETGLFLIRTLAADQRLRVIEQAEHRGAAGEVTLVSWIIGPRSMARV